MPKLKTRLPKLCRDRKLAISWYNGERVYHGLWGTPDAEKNYKRFIAALLESPALPLRIDKQTDVLVSELAGSFIEHIESQNMDKTDVAQFKTVIGYLAGVYGELSVNEFSPKKLKVVQSQMVKAGTLSRKTINKYTGYVKRIFDWGVEEEIVQASVVYALRIVKNLKEGTHGTFDHPEREAVPEWVIAATLPFLSPTVAAMVQVQWLTGCRPSEIFNMRVGDIDRSRGNGLWYYSPKHKTERHIGKKSIVFGEGAQALIAPYIVSKKTGAAVFSPRTAMKERATQAR
jgi:site-specific recombinase XerD